MLSAAGSGGYTTLNPRQPLNRRTLRSSCRTVHDGHHQYHNPVCTLEWLNRRSAGFADGIDNDTQYSAGTGLTLSSTQFSLTASFRLPQGCGNNQIAIGWVASGRAITTPTVAATSPRSRQGTGLSGVRNGDVEDLAVSYGGTGSAVTVSRSDHTHFGQSWTGNAIYGLQVTTNQDSSTGLQGQSNAANYGSGVSGVSAATNGAGVHGVASDTTGVNVGSYGQSNTSSGTGVWGYAFATGAGTSYGVRGLSNTTSGVGVYGLAFAARVVAPKACSELVIAPPALAFTVRQRLQSVHPTA